MDLYEALKAGTDPAELKKKFEEELKVAMDKLDNEENLSAIRTELSFELTEYLSALLGNEIEKLLPPEEIEKILSDMEKDLKLAYKAANKTVKEFKINCSKSDEDIIEAFLKTLKR